MHAVVTRRTVRKLGFGRRLLSRYEAELARVGTPRGLLITAADSGADEFYRRMGWQETAKRMDRDGRDVIEFHRSIG